MTTEDPLVAAFEDDMVGIYHRAKSIGYNATRYLAMVREHGGLETAHRLLASSSVSYGFAELWMLGRRDLTVEALVLEPRYHGLFTSGELQTARDRLGVRSEETAPVEPVAAPAAGEPEPGAAWTLDSFIHASAERGAAIETLVRRFANWAAERGAARLGGGRGGPLYFAPRAPDGDAVLVVSVSLDGSVQILLDQLRKHAPFDRLALRIELQRRLNRLVGFALRDEVVEVGTWQTVDGAYLLSPGAFDHFSDAYDWVAARLNTGTVEG